MNCGCPAFGDGCVTITVLDAAPPVAGELVTRLRTVYDDEIAETGLPVTAEELVFGVLLEHTSFAEPTAPLPARAGAPLV